MSSEKISDTIPGAFAHEKVYESTILKPGLRNPFSLLRELLLPDPVSFSPLQEPVPTGRKPSGQL